MKGEYGFFPIMGEVDFLVIEKAVMRGVIQDSDIPKSEKDEKQDETSDQLEQPGCSWTLESLRQKMDSEEEREIQEDDNHTQKTLLLFSQDAFDVLLDVNNKCREG
jgi:hypothetical protein